MFFSVVTVVSGMPSGRSAIYIRHTWKIYADNFDDDGLDLAECLALLSNINYIVLFSPQSNDDDNL